MKTFKCVLLSSTQSGPNPFWKGALHILASGAIRNLIVASKPMYCGMGNTFLYNYLEIFNIGCVGNQGGGHIGIQNGCHFKFNFYISYYIIYTCLFPLIFHIMCEVQWSPQLICEWVPQAFIPPLQLLPKTVKIASWAFAVHRPWIWIKVVWACSTDIVYFRFASPQAKESRCFAHREMSVSPCIHVVCGIAPCV